MSSTINMLCVYCVKECRGSDSKPYPSSKSKDRIHNRCYIKKSLSDKQVKCMGSSKPSDKPSSCISGRMNDPKQTPIGLLEKLHEDNEKMKANAEALKMTNMIKAQEQQAEKSRGESSFFFDIKAGIAKPNEKRRFLNHRKICEMAPRYDDHGFKEDAIGRSYDHTGNDLNEVSDQSDSDIDDRSGLRSNSNSMKRKCDDSQNQSTVNKKPNSRIDLSENHCWFCLSSPNVEKHLIIAIGTNCYLTLAKGGLTDEHLMLIPIEHIASVTDRRNTKELLAEKELFVDHIVEYFEKKSMGVVFFERNFRSVHWQIQAVPISKKNMPDLDTRIQEISKVHFTNSQYKSFSSPLQISDIIPPNAAYLHWRIEPSNLNFASVIDVKGSFFPVLLPRMILAQVLGCTDRIDWKKCCKNREEYMQLVARIKKKWER